MKKPDYITVYVLGQPLDLIPVNSRLGKKIAKEVAKQQAEIKKLDRKKRNVK